MEILKLKRKYLEDQTIGTLTGKNTKLVTVELVDNDNKPKESCIPEGEYVVVIRNSKKYGNHFHVTNVKKRDLILFHVANYSRELLGCIAPGLRHKDIDKDGKLDNESSKLAMDHLLKTFPQGFKLLIYS